MSAHGSSRWADAANRSLATAGHRSGGARAAVVDLLARQDCCLSAQEIFDELRAQDRRVGIASVYRALDLLHALGLIQRLDVGGSAARFEPALHGDDHHHHVVCERCGEVTTFEDAALENALEAIARRLPHAVSGHDVTLRGACAACRA